MLRMQWYGAHNHINNISIKHIYLRRKTNIFTFNYPLGRFIRCDLFVCVFLPVSLYLSRCPQKKNALITVKISRSARKNMLFVVVCEVPHQIELKTFNLLIRIKRRILNKPWPIDACKV